MCGFVVAMAFFLFGGAYAFPAFASNSGSLAQNFDIVVLGVIVSNDKNRGIALIKHEQSRHTEAVRVGSKVQEAVLSEVYQKFVVFKSGERTFKVPVGGKAENSGYAPTDAQMTTAAAGIERDGNLVRASTSFRDKLVNEDLSKVLMQAAATPHYEGNALRGFQLSRIDKDSIFDQLGFKDGDIITEINGTELINVASTIKLLQQLKSAARADVSFRRNGMQQNLTVQIQ